VPHCIEVDAVPTCESSQDLLFVGANNVENEQGLQKFVEEALPIIRSRFPNMRLRICGRVGKHLAGEDNVYTSGNVEDLTPYYQKALLTINASPIGTGLKIKTVEALCHGRCLVSTPAGVQGIERHSDIFVLAETMQAFASRVTEILENPVRASAVGMRARQFAAEYFSPERVLGALARRLETILMARR
jgi:glycosyltransferase involved in cell wall biosynthesis